MSVADAAGVLVADADWPPAVEVLNPTGASDTVLICEHASRHIPAEFAGLGLPESELARHIAWDIGAAAVTRALAARLDAVAYLAGYSRLLIDLNRPEGVPTSIPARSEATDIPGNRALGPQERERRAALMFRPFHACVAAGLDARDRAGRRTRIVAIHSFTPVYFGRARPWHAGILFNACEGLATHILGALGQDPRLNLALNEPYVVSRDEDYAILVHGEDRGYEAVLIEIRNDLISDEAGVADWVERLAGAIPA